MPVLRNDPNRPEPRSRPTFRGWSAQNQNTFRKQSPLGRRRQRERTRRPRRHRAKLRALPIRTAKIQNPSPAARENLTPLLGAAAGVIILLLIIVLFLVFRGGSSTPPPSPSASSDIPTLSSNDATPAPVNLPPSFCGIPIDQQVVVYVIDNGSSSADVFDAVKTALFHSIDSLGPDRRFQILFWNPQTPAFPSTGVTFAVKDNVDAAKKKLTDATAFGTTDPAASLTAAIADDPGQIIVITAKAGDLDDSLVQKVTTLRGSSKARIDCIAINGHEDDKVLAKIAAQTGGQYLPLPDAKLRSFAF